ncbi:MAG: hypothetical protein AB1716_21585 [Planctomycetota bacterium]
MLPDRLEFGNPEYVRLVRAVEERAAREEERARRVAEGPFRECRVTYAVWGGGEVVVEAADGEHARELVEEGDVPLDSEWEEFQVEGVAAIGGSEPASAEKGAVPPQLEFRFAGREGGGTGRGGGDARRGGGAVEGG